MITIEYNERTLLGYDHIPILASANVITGTKYITKIYLIQGDSKYLLGEVDEKLDEEDVKARFGELININKERQYGTQRPLLRRELEPRRTRLNRGISRSIIQD